MRATQEITLLSGEERHAAAPETFEIPSLSERRSVPVGGYAKLIFTNGIQVERMWVKVTRALSSGSYYGELDNDPFLLDLKCGKGMEFQPEHIISILGEEE